jgi:hypothetical protein
MEARWNVERHPDASDRRAALEGIAADAGGEPAPRSVRPL